GRLIVPRLVPGGNRLDVAGLDTAGVVWGEVVPSPDAQWIAATRHRAGHWSLVRWPASAPESLAVLVDDGGTVSDPAWDGEALLFVADWTGLPQSRRWSPGRPLHRRVHPRQRRGGPLRVRPRYRRRPLSAARGGRVRDRFARVRQPQPRSIRGTPVELGLRDRRGDRGVGAGGQRGTRGHAR